MRKAFLLIVLPVVFSGSLLSYTDGKHFSKVFNEERSFRVFTPPDYSSLNQAKRYPVIYYFHGCGGSYEKSGTYSYADFGLTPPSVSGRKHDPAYDFSSNADFENFTFNNDVIIISVDGKIYGLAGCGVYFPSQDKDWKGNYYNFSLYIRELFDVIDSRYNTKKGPQYRAISGLSMGGNTAIWIAAANPHLFSSASEFCYSPNFYDVGEPSYSTTVDIQQLWRNLRGLPFRHTTTTGDYIKHYTTEVYNAFKGAGFDNEYYRAEFCNHHAARVDLQFDFHMRHFNTEKKTIPCFSVINLYPDFETWGYEVKSDKKEAGWIYLRNVSKNGAGIYTRRNLPWGRSLSEFKISVFTPPVYIPGEEYKLVHYSYKNDEIWEERTRADRNGKLVLTSGGGAGEEIGITGKELQPPVIILADTINENIYLENNRLTPLSFEILNLSESAQLVEISAAAVETGMLSFTRHTSTVLLQARSRTRIDSMLICKALISSPEENRAFIRISMKAGGVLLDREHILPLVVKSRTISDKDVQVKIFDGRSEELPVFSYAWNEWDRPLSTAMISEGKGNGNGKAEPGEIFSVWVKLPDAYDPRDTDTWHPVIPINNAYNQGVVLEDIAYHSFSTGRSLLSGMIRLDKKSSEENPVRFAVQSELLRTELINNHCHRPVADDFGYAYLNIHISEDGTASIINKETNPNSRNDAWRIERNDSNGELFLIICRRSDDGSIGNELDGALYRSSDGAETWIKIKLPDGTNGPMSLASDMGNSDNILMSAWGRVSPGQFTPDTGGGIFLSEDTGKTWKQTLSKDQHIHDITYDKRIGTFYACGFNGSAYRSEDRGETWNRIKGYNFKWGKRVDPDSGDPDKIFIITFGGGVWYGPAKGDESAVEDIITPVLQ